jgi:hypothetical protein
MTDHGKFTADAARVGAAQNGMEDLAGDVLGMITRFHRNLDGYEEILGHDEFGKSAGGQLEQQRTQLEQAGVALAKVLNAVPEMFRAQQNYIVKTQLGVVDSIHDAGNGPFEAPPEPGGKPGKY